MITYHRDLIQGSEDWHAVRCGLLTASEMKLILTPTLKLAANEKEKAHLYELLAQRITGYVEPQYVSFDMVRGQEDEIEARTIYEINYGPVQNVGFITNDRWGFTLGYSPDAVVGDDGLIECKSRRQKFQIETLVNNVPDGVMPPDFMIQVQTGLLVSERKWCDLISYSGGLPMATIRAYPIPDVQSAIVEAAAAFETRIATARIKFDEVMASKDARLIPTERRTDMEISI